MKFNKLSEDLKVQEKECKKITYEVYTKEYSIPLAHIYRDKSIIQRNMPKRKVRKFKSRKGIL